MKSKHTFCVQWSIFISKIVSFMSKCGKILRSGAGQMTVWRMRVACWITKATHTNTHSEYIVLTASTPQHKFHERPSKLRYTYIACLVCSNIHTIWLHILILFIQGNQRRNAEDPLFTKSGNINYGCGFGCVDNVNKSASRSFRATGYWNKTW